MRRPQPELPISPKVLKHFAIVTVVLTALLALFVNGEDSQIAAEIKARETKNQLIAAEADKLGTKKLSAALGMQKARPDPGPVFDVADPVSAPTSVGRVSNDTSFQRGGMVSDFVTPPKELGMKAGGGVSISGQELENTPGASKRKGLRQKKQSAFKPDEQQKADLMEVSRQRTGSASIN